ncbi:MAG: thiolase domain-containing protein [Candidatus Asgardarchaeia archaeon]
MRDVAVIGVGMTKVGQHFEKAIRDLFIEAALKAIDSAGNPNIDALYVGNMVAGETTGQSNLGTYLSDYLGLRVPAFHIENACSSGGATFINGVLAVASGYFDTVLVGGVEKLTEHPSAVTTQHLAEAADQEYEVYFGASFTSLNAMIMRYYMHKYNVPREYFAEWPVMMHEHATHNPYAQFRFKTTIEKVLASPIIADPLTLFDCSPTGDGAAAVIITTLENARKLQDTIIKVAGLGIATDSISIALREDLATLKATVESAKKAYAMAKIQPTDIDVAEIHDAFSIMAILALEDLGFSEKGRGAFDLHEGKFSKDGRIAINPSGGLKARGHPVGATGVYQIAEIALQLKGEAEGIQVADPQIGLAQNIGGSGSSVTTVILKRER